MVVGNTSFNGVLSVVGNGATNGLTVKSAGNGGTFPFRVTWTSGTDGDMLCVNDNGNVGIGTTLPLAKIQTEVGNTTGIGLYSASGLAITSTGGSTGNIYQISFGYGGGSATYGSSALYGLTESNVGYNTGALVFATRSETTDTAPTERMRITSGGTVQPGANGTQDLGTSSLRWATVYTSDLSLSNGIGDYTIVEGEHDLFLYNNKNNKVYKFLVEEVDPSTATPKKS